MIQDLVDRGALFVVNHSRYMAMEKKLGRTMTMLVKGVPSALEQITSTAATELEAA